MATKVRSEYEIGLKDDVSAKLRGIQSGFDKFKVGVSAAAGVVTAGGVALAALTKNAVNLADDLGKTAQRAGVSVEALSSLKLAADLSDVSFNELGGALQKLSRNMAEALRGSAEGARGFNALGVSITTANGSLRATEDVFSDVAEALSKLPDGATKTALAMQAFGRSGAQLIPLLNGGAEGLREFTREAERLGVVVSTETAAEAAELNDNLTRLKASAQGVGLVLARDLVPTINDIGDAFKRGYEQGGLLDASIMAWQETVRQALGDPLQDQIQDTQDEIRELEDALKSLRGETASGAFVKGINEFFGTDSAAEKQIAKTIDEIERLQGKLAALKDTRNVTRPGAGPADDSAKRAAEEEAARLLAEEEARKKAEAAAVRLQKTQDNYLAGLKRQLSLEGESTELARVKADIQFGSAAKFSEAAQEQATALAEQLDILRDTADVHEYLLSVEKDRRAQAEQAKVALAQERQATIESLRNPTEQYVAEVQRLLSLDLDSETLERGIVRASDELDRARDKADGAADAAKDFSLTLTSAFSEAIVQGRELSDVLEGLLRDFAQIILKKTLLAPLESAITGAFEPGGGGLGGLFSGLFGNATGGLYKVGGSSAEHAVAFTARAGEVVAVGTGMESGGGLSVVVNNYSSERVQTRERRGAGGRRELEVAIGELTAGNVGAGRFAAMGILPPLAAR